MRMRLVVGLTSNSFFNLRRTPRMLFNLADGQATIDVTIEHIFDEVDVELAHDPWNA